MFASLIGASVKFPSGPSGGANKLASSCARLLSGLPYAGVSISWALHFHFRQSVNHLGLSRAISRAANQE